MKVNILLFFKTIFWSKSYVNKGFFSKIEFTLITEIISILTSNIQNLLFNINL